MQNGAGAGSWWGRFVFAFKSPLLALPLSLAVPAVALQKALGQATAWTAGSRDAGGPRGPGSPGRIWGAGAGRRSSDAGLPGAIRKGTHPPHRGY
jgi:hypothetical protein